ncbi:hypothetical protein IV203_005990 [Nitzschia inconspicua]|uniref:Transmembrane protein n=1 Tax=Nitzschia inconspicua TaxID=303405 RepID=A0A9K3KP49_9STRA|nr:hypothetical protein IV203_005990 [Nitzschia inconspicua]
MLGKPVHVIVFFLHLLAVRHGIASPPTQHTRNNHALEVYASTSPLQNEARQQESIQGNQNEKFVSKPSLHWNGFHLNMDYMVSKALSNQLLGYGVYSDKNCGKEIPTNGAPMVIDFIMDPVIEENIPEGLRTIRLSLLLMPEKIFDASYITVDESGLAAVSFCTRVWTKKTEVSSQADFLREFHVLMYMELEPGNGIVGVREDRSSAWNVKTFMCDSESNEITGFIPPTSQKERIRLCVVPTPQTLQDGIYISSIQNLVFRRDSKVQSIINNGQAVSNDGSTHILCHQGSTVCTIDSLFDDQFFESPGTIEISGSVSLQFGYEYKQRSLLRKPVHVDVQNNQSEMNRLLYEVGESVGEKSILYFVGVTPSEENIGAEAFRCNTMNERITDEVSLMEQVDPIRICVQPVAKSLGSGVQLEDSFYVTRGSVVATGDVYLHFESSPHTRRLNEAEFAGPYLVKTRFEVLRSSAASRHPKTLIQSSPMYLRVMYVIAIGIAILISACTCCGLLYFFLRGRHIEEITVESRALPKQRDIDDSVDARMDSNTSFYSDFEFDTDGSGNSSDAESITESSDEDLKANAYAILFPANPNPKDLSQSLGGSSPIDAGNQQRNSMPIRKDFQLTRNKTVKRPGSSSLPRVAHDEVNQLSRKTKAPNNGRVSLITDPLTNLECAYTTTSDPSRQHLPKTTIGPPPRPTKKANSLPTYLYLPSNGKVLSQLNQPSQSRSFSPNRSQERRRSTSFGPSFGSDDVHQPVLEVTEQRPRRRVPKGKKSSFSRELLYDQGCHPGGITQIPRAELSQSLPQTIAGKTTILGESKKGSKEKKQQKKKGGKVYQTGEKGCMNPSIAQSKKRKKKHTKTIDSVYGDCTDNCGLGASVLAANSESGYSKGTGATEDSKLVKEAESRESTMPMDDDVCFEAEDHPGTEAFLLAIENTLTTKGPAVYAPIIYRHIKRQLLGRRFFVCDDDDKPFEWREATKSELIDLFWKYYEEQKSQKYGVSIEEEFISLAAQ